MKKIFIRKGNKLIEDIGKAPGNAHYSDGGWQQEWDSYNKRKEEMRIYELSEALSSTIPDGGKIGEDDFFVGMSGNLLDQTEYAWPKQ